MVDSECVWFGWMDGWMDNLKGGLWVDGWMDG